MKVIGKLTQAQLQLFEENRSCKAACKEVVTEAILHYEKAVRLDWIFWRGIKSTIAEHLNDQERGRLSLNHDTGEVTVMTEKECAERELERRFEDEAAFMAKFKEFGKEHD